MNGIVGTLLPSLSFGVFGMNQMIFAGQRQRVRLPLAVECRSPEHYNIRYSAAISTPKKVLYVS